MGKYDLAKEDTALIIVDLQVKLMAAMSQKEKVLNNTKLLLALAQQYQLPVMVTEQYPRGLGETVEEIKDALPDHIRFEKVRFSACSDELLENLRSTGRSTIVMVGSETHVCVFQTARDLLEQGYNVHIARDAVCSRFKENHKNGLALMQEMGAVINNTETIIFNMLEEAGSPEFRAISPLLK